MILTGNEIRARVASGSLVIEDFNTARLPSRIHWEMGEEAKA